jgi:hypothetical protein
MNGFGDRIDWMKGLDGAILCWLGYVLLFPHSAALGLAAMGVGSLLIGLALGRE